MRGSPVPELYGHEVAASGMRALLHSDAIDRLREANEATTRLLIIDQVLALLGWHKTEYDPERRTPTGGYTDYLLALDGVPRLVVEAKRTNLFEPLPKVLQKRHYSNAFLYNHCGLELRALLDQCRAYIAETGAPFAVATTGAIWVVLLGFKAGASWDKLRAFVFHSLDDVDQHFGEFYGLLSREAVRANSLEEQFGGILQSRPRAAIRPRLELATIPDLAPVPDRQFIEAFFAEFMDDITIPGREQMLDHCYVENDRLDEFSRDLLQILEYDPILTEQGYPIADADRAALEAALEAQFDASAPKTILLVGNVGAGKSTFVHRFIRDKTVGRGSHLCVVINLIDEATINIAQDRAEEQRLARLVLERVEELFAGRLDPYEAQTLRACFEAEVGRFRKQHILGFNADRRAYDLSEARHVAELAEDPYRHLVGFIKLARKKRFKLWLAFDNVDRGSASYQAFVYAFAHRLSKATRCVTLITLREDTFSEAQEAGFLDVRNTDTVFRLHAPEIRQVVAERRKYIDWLIEHEQVPGRFRANLPLLRLLNWHIKHLITGDDGAVRAFVTTCSLRNIRAGLALIRDYYTSPHATFHAFNRAVTQGNPSPEDSAFAHTEEYSRFIRAMMLGNGWTYDEANSPLANVFAVDLVERTSHFLPLQLLAYLDRQRIPTSAKIAARYSDVIRDFVFLGHARHQIDAAMRRLIATNLVTSPDLPADPSRETLSGTGSLVETIKVALSAKGHHHLAELAGHPYYQTRVGEDTVWYDKESATRYVRCLRESAEAYDPSGSADILQATEAREIFLEYLRQSLLEEVNDRPFSTGLARTIYDVVEREVFGRAITQIAPPASPDTPSKPTEPSRPIGARRRSRGHDAAPPTGQAALQIPLREQEVPDYHRALTEAAASVGALPRHVRVGRSQYVVRALWALELASRANVGPQSASDIARLIRTFGGEEVAEPNVAKFFRNQKLRGEFSLFWDEDEPGMYRISASGRNALTTLLVQSDDATS